MGYGMYMSFTSDIHTICMFLMIKAVSALLCSASLLPTCILGCCHVLVSALHRVWCFVQIVSSVCLHSVASAVTARWATTVKKLMPQSSA